MNKYVLRTGSRNYLSSTTCYYLRSTETVSPHRRRERAVVRRTRRSARGVVPDGRFGKATMEGSAFPEPQGAAGNRFARSRLGRVLLGFRVGAECEGLSGNLVESGRCAWVFGGDYYAADVGDILLSHVCSI